MGKNKFSSQQSTGIFSFWKNSCINYISIKKSIHFSYYLQRLIHNVMWNIFVVKLYLKNNNKYVTKKSKLRYSFFKKFKKRKSKIINGSVWFLKYQNWVLIRYNYVNTFKFTKNFKKNFYIDFSILNNKDLNYKNIF